MRSRAAVLRSLGTEPPFASSGDIDVIEVDLDGPGPGEVLVRVEAAGLCHSDLSVVDGSRPRPVPMVLGHEGAGMVEAIGPEVTEVSPGDRVVCTFVPSCGTCEQCSAGRPVLCRSAQEANTAGRLVTGTRPFRDGGEPLHQHLGVSAFSEFTVVSPRSLVPIPEDIPLPVAAVFGYAVLTGVGAVLNTAGVAAGDSVAVFGLGGVGLSAVMGAVVAGAASIIAVDLQPEKLALAGELGATLLVDASQSGAGSEIATVTGGGVDWCFETAGSAAVLSACYEAARPGGSVIAVGLPHPAEQFSIQAVSLVAREMTIRGSYMGSSVPRRDLPKLLRLHAAGRLPVDRLISRRGMALTDLGVALDDLHAGAAVRQIIEPHV